MDSHSLDNKLINLNTLVTNIKNISIELNSLLNETIQCYNPIIESYQQKLLSVLNEYNVKGLTIEDKLNSISSFLIGIKKQKPAIRSKKEIKPAGLVKFDTKKLTIQSYNTYVSPILDVYLNFKSKFDLILDIEKESKELFNDIISIEPMIMPYSLRVKNSNFEISESKKRIDYAKENIKNHKKGIEKHDIEKETQIIKREEQSIIDNKHIINIYANFINTKSFKQLKIKQKDIVVLDDNYKSQIIEDFLYYDQQINLIDKNIKVNIDIIEQFLNDCKNNYP